MGGVGVALTVSVGRDVSVGRAGGVLVLLGLGITVEAGAIVGGGGEANDPQLCRRMPRSRKMQTRRIMFRMISQASAFSTRDVWRRQWQFHNPHQRVAPRPCLDLLSGLFAI